MPATPTIDVPPAGPYRLDPAQSAVTFGTRHLWGIAPVNGEFSLAGGEIQVATSTAESQAMVTIDAASFDTGNALRDKTVKSEKFLHVSQYPKISFQSTKAVQDGDRWLLRGEVTACGIPEQIELEILQVQEDSGALLLHATTQIDRYAHGVTKAKGMAARHLKLYINARATRT